MKTRVVLSVAGLAGAAILVGQMSVGAFPGTGADDRAAELPGSTMRGEMAAGGTSGPDVIVWELYGWQNYGPSGDYRAYAVGTKSCNIGDEELSWRDNGGDNRHPVISQNMYRYKPDAKGNGRFEQIGQAWLKHGFCALDGNECLGCQSNGDCDWLGIGCSDPYSASLNGNQSNAGPKYQVNAYDGVFPYPPANPPYSGPTARRLRVALSDVQAVMNPGAIYFVESQYVTQDDAQTGHGLNNASYRQVNLTSAGAISGYAALTVKETPALQEWFEQDPQVTFTRIDIPSEGRLNVAHRVYDNGDGTWDYEYVIFNLNSDRSVGGFSLPVPDSVTLTEVGFHDVDYHSNEPFDGTDWPATRGAGEQRWETDDYATNPDANAIRWGTAYNFRFTADSPPVVATATIELFKPGTPTSMPVNVKVPSTLDCPSDANDDGTVDILDLLQILADWGSAGGPSDVNDDGAVDVLDLLQVLGDWGCTV